jgi:hypothetical protein
MEINFRERWRWNRAAFPHLLVRLTKRWLPGVNFGDPPTVSYIGLYYRLLTLDVDIRNLSSVLSPELQIWDIIMAPSPTQVDQQGQSPQPSPETLTEPGTPCNITRVDLQWPMSPIYLRTIKSLSFGAKYLGEFDAEKIFETYDNVANSSGFPAPPSIRMWE